MALQHRPQITFDPYNVEHVLAIRSQITEKTLNSRFRFHLEEGYSSVLTMVTDKMAKAYMDQFVGKAPLSLEVTEKHSLLPVEAAVIKFRRPKETA